jgi:hypothetical protein
VQVRIIREYATKRAWTIAVQVKEIGSGAVERQLRQQLFDAAMRRDINLVRVFLRLTGSIATRAVYAA